MTTATLLFLPPRMGDPWRWLRIANDIVTARGEGVPEADGAPIVAIAPADAVTLHWAALPDRSIAQATAAARIVAGEASAAPQEQLHVAVGDTDGADRAIGVVAADRMREWLDSLLAIGIDPAVLVPAPLLLPPAAEGFVRADLGGQAVVRGQASGFADEAGLTELVTSGIAIETLDRASLERALAQAAAAPALNLRQGAFARRRRREIDWPLVRRVALLIGLTLFTMLAIDLVRITRYSLAADRLEAQADDVARQALPRGIATGGDTNRLLVERLTRLRGPGQGFTRTLAAMLAAIRATPGSEATALDFQPNGDLRATVTVEGDAQANALQARLRDANFTVSAGPFESTGGQLKGELTVSSR
ncbi:MAG: type II secretion system protein GspL [Candidatus Sphingomonas colombiensis]|nr:type II secretion system protein GspL [Sphingomonas sp.]WEK43438.1 MAG: type II secretion system protein GspL [Sphingomonas sp.]